jgi:hypothetical protein
MPCGDKNPEQKALEFSEMIKKQSPSVEMQKLLKKVQGTNSMKTLAVKLLSALNEQFMTQSILGKTELEITELLRDIKDDSGESESKKSSRKYKESQSRSQNRGRNRRADNDVIRRGTRRGEVPVPTIEKVGGSRIVARKLF